MAKKKKQAVSVNTPAENSAVAQFLSTYKVGEERERRYKSLRKAALMFISNKHDADEELLKIKEEQTSEHERLAKAIADLQNAEAQAASAIRERMKNSKEIKAAKRRLENNNTEYIAFILGLRTAEAADIALAKKEAAKPFIEAASLAKARLEQLGQQYNISYSYYKEEAMKAERCFVKAEQFK